MYLGNKDMTSLISINELTLVSEHPSHWDNFWDPKVVQYSTVLLTVVHCGTVTMFVVIATHYVTTRGRELVQ